MAVDFSSENRIREPRLTRLGDLLEEWQAEAAAVYEARRTGQPQGPVTGFPRLDERLGGRLAPGLHILHGGPGVGKTAFVLQVAAQCRSPALFVSCEMAPLELFRRLTARVTGTFLGRLKSGELLPEQSLALARRAAAEAPLLALVDATTAWPDPSWLREAALAVRGDHLLIVVDSVHSWGEMAPTEGLSEYDLLNAALTALRQLAGLLDCPILVTAERNRFSMKTGGLHAAAGSRKFEFGGETVLGVDRDLDAKPDPLGEVPVTLKVLKNRHGPVGEVPFRWHGALQRFREVER